MDGWPACLPVRSRELLCAKETVWPMLQDLPVRCWTSLVKIPKVHPPTQAEPNFPSAAVFYFQKKF